VSEVRRLAAAGWCSNRPGSFGASSPSALAPHPVLQSCAGRIGATVRALLADLLRLGASRPAMPTLPAMPSLPGDIVRGVTGEEARRAGRPFVVSIEGNIGSGKSTMLKYFEKFQDVELVPEPVAEWCDVKGHNLLGKLYEDPKRWSFQFQSYVQLTRLQLLKKPTDCSVKIIERSIQNNRFCFLENARREGSLSGSELAVLFEWYSWLDNNLGIPLDLIVYLRTSPQVAYERLRQRGRKEEAGVPMDFIEGLHRSYEDWLIQQSQGALPAPLLILDADQGIESMLRTYEQFTEEIRGRKPYTGAPGHRGVRA